MSDFWNRVSAIKQQQNAAALAKQDAAIGQASDFWNRVDGIKQQQNAAALAKQDAAISKASDFWNRVENDGFGSALFGTLGFDPEPNNPSKKPYPKSAEDVVSYPVSIPVVDYLNADLAKHYGLSKETAYQEALENTSYQRAVKDMKAAGLNPAVMFGSGRADGAGSNVHVTSSGSGGSGGYSRRSGGSSKKNDKLFTTGEFYGISAAVGLLTAVATKNPANFWLGQTATQGFMTAANGLFGK